MADLGPPPHAVLPELLRSNYSAKNERLTSSVWPSKPIREDPPGNKFTQTARFYRRGNRRSHGVVGQDFYFRMMGDSKMRTRVVQLIVFMALISCVATMGQVLKGSISGTAADPNGAVIPGATVKATNSDTGAVLKTTTNNEGVFRFSLIPAGDYKLEITAPGFQTVVQNGVVVVAGRASSLNVVKIDR